MAICSSDNILAVVVDHKTLFTYTETDPFGINYFGFATGEEGKNANFFYNCKPKPGNDVSYFNSFLFYLQ